MIKTLAKIKEEQGLIDEAAELMQEIAVSVVTGIVGFLYLLYHILWLFIQYLQNKKLRN